MCSCKALLVDRRPTVQMQARRDTPRLTPEELKGHLNSLPAWRVTADGTALSRKFVARNFMAGAPLSMITGSCYAVRDALTGIYSQFFSQSRAFPLHCTSASGRTRVHADHCRRRSRTTRCRRHRSHGLLQRGRRAVRVRGPPPRPAPHKLPGRGGGGLPLPLPDVGATGVRFRRWPCLDC